MRGPDPVAPPPSFQAPPPQRSAPTRLLLVVVVIISTYTIPTFQSPGFWATFRRRARDFLLPARVFLLSGVTWTGGGGGGLSEVSGDLRKKRGLGAAGRTCGGGGLAGGGEPPRGRGRTSGWEVLVAGANAGQRIRGIGIRGGRCRRLVGDAAAAAGEPLARAAGEANSARSNLERSFRIQGLSIVI